MPDIRYVCLSDMHQLAATTSPFAGCSSQRRLPKLCISERRQPEMCHLQSWPLCRVDLFPNEHPEYHAFPRPDAPQGDLGLGSRELRLA